MKKSFILRYFSIILCSSKIKKSFLRIASKTLVRNQQNLYTVFEWIWRSNLQNFIFPDKCFVRKWRLKFQMSKYRLRWNTENMTRSIISPQKKLHNHCFYKYFTTGNRRVCSLEMTVSTSFDDIDFYNNWAAKICFLLQLPW